MLKKIVWQVALATVVMASPAWAQEKRVEVSALVGWTFADGVEGQSVITPSGIFDRVDPKDSFKWGLGVGFLATENAEVGFLFGQQMTTLQAGGTSTVDIGDTNINTYHGYFAYNWGTSDAPLRPYAMFGLGATNYGGVDFTRINGQEGTIGSETQFSTTWGAGVKYFASPSVGARFGIQWTPTYIKSDAAGYWCDPYWGCYLVGDAQYSNQWDISGGITFRF
jgi:opacity protein-like surface antigen